ncbi:hypothetical protein OS493_038671 [Desmophyllum pertusum]|uniref:Uncharacterized protein n=1 Tax=Desmophyllum pertusum TaxID=174260 RepID=A0A9X0CTT2_9CNID|nr:hypothetical protein OS493_038671 [Desmophyllum pertusum]
MISLTDLSSSIDERASLLIHEPTVLILITTTGPGSPLSSMAKVVPKAGTIAEVLSSASIFPTSSSRFHLSPVEMASVSTTCTNCNDFSLLMSSSLKRKPVVAINELRQY